MASVSVKLDRAAIYPLLQNAAMDKVLEDSANELAARAGAVYEVITENQNRKTRSVTAVGRTDPRGMFDEAETGTLARALSGMEQPWSR